MISNKVMDNRCIKDEFKEAKMPNKLKVATRLIFVSHTLTLENKSKSTTF